MKAGMKTTDKLIWDLRVEYMELQQKIAAANFALANLPFDDQEISMLRYQVEHMEDYADALIMRAGYARKVTERLPKRL